MLPFAFGCGNQVQFSVLFFYDLKRAATQDLLILSEQYSNVAVVTHPNRLFLHHGRQKLCIELLTLRELVIQLTRDRVLVLLHY